MLSTGSCKSMLEQRKAPICRNMQRTSVDPFCRQVIRFYHHVPVLCLSITVGSKSVRSALAVVVISTLISKEPTNILLDIALYVVQVILQSLHLLRSFIRRKRFLHHAKKQQSACFSHIASLFLVTISSVSPFVSSV